MNISLKKHGEKTNPSLKIYVNKIEIRILFKVKIEYYLELLMPEMITIKLLGSNKSKITNYKNDENVPNSGITESESSYIEVWFIYQNYKLL